MMKQSKRKGVASVVGTMLSLMVFLSIFTLVTSQYIPLWMQANETTYLDEVTHDMISLDHALTMESLSNSTAITERTPFTMESADVPVLSPPTSGSMSYMPSEGLESVTFWLPYEPGSSSSGQFITLGNLYSSSPIGYGGAVKYYVPSRYIQTETLTLENGALIVSTGSNYILRIFPQFNILSYNVGGSTYRELYLNMYAIYGKPATGVGPGDQTVYTSLLGEQQYTEVYYGYTESVTLTILTQYPTAWVSYFHTYWPSFTSVPTSTPDSSSTMNQYFVTVTIYSISTLHLVISSYSLSMYSGGVA